MPNLARTRARSADFGNSDDLAAAANLTAGDSVPPLAPPASSQPSDPDPVAQISFNPSQTKLMPVNQAVFTKETLGLFKINPHSTSVQK